MLCSVEDDNEILKKTERKAFLSFHLRRTWAGEQKHDHIQSYQYTSLQEVPSGFSKLRSRTSNM